MNKWHSLIFLAIALSVFAGMHWYVYARTATALSLGAYGRAYFRLFFLMGALSFVAAAILTHRISPAWTRPVAFTANAWVGILAITLTAFVLADLASLLTKDPSFRLAAVRTALVLGLVASGIALWNSARAPLIREITLDLLPAGSKPFSIVQLSDIHLDSLSPVSYIKGIVTRTNALDPDVIVITGDLIDADICRVPDMCPALRELRSRNGVFAISGNHEFYTGMEIFLAVAEHAGIRVLRGERIAVGPIELAGIDDDISALGPKAAPFIQQLLAGRDVKKPAVLLSHRPDTFDAARAAGASLQLSGHTHAGQIPPMDLIVQFAFKYPQGLYRRGDSFLYTTPGTGVWGPPMRLFSRSEIVRITLIPR